MSEIKMRVNYKPETVCSNCGMKYKNTPTMYDIMIFGEVKHICYDCVDKLFHKTLSAEIAFQNKTKSKEDMARITRNKMLKEQKQ